MAVSGDASTIVWRYATLQPNRPNVPELIVKEDLREAIATALSETPAGETTYSAYQLC